MVMLFWKEEEYLVREGEYSSHCLSFLVFLVIHLVESQAIALDLTLWCLKEVLNWVDKLAKVPMVVVVSAKALCLKVVAQIRAAPLVI